MIDECRIQNDLEGSGRGVVEVLPLAFFRETKENNLTFQSE
jgi:hypothetical protein